MFIPRLVISFFVWKTANYFGCEMELVIDNSRAWFVRQVFPLKHFSLKVFGRALWPWGGKAGSAVAEPSTKGKITDQE